MRSLLAAGALGVASVAMLITGCTPGGDRVSVATWDGEWPHTDMAHAGMFAVRDACLQVRVEGQDFIAVLPAGAVVEGDRVKSAGSEYALGAEVTLGGSGMDLAEARQATSVTLPPACEGRASQVWLVTG